MTSTKRILIIRFSSIGDILLSTPFIRQTRIAFHDAIIDFVTKTQYADLLKFNPHINHLYLFDDQQGLGGLLQLKQTIKSKKYDYILDLHNNLRSRILTFGLGAKVFRMKKNKLKRALLVYLKINLFPKPIPIAQKYLKVGEKIGVQDDGLGLELFWKDNNVKNVLKNLPANLFNERFIALAPGAGFKTKQWPLEYFRALIQMLSNKTAYEIVLLGSQEEADQFRPLVISENVINLAGTLSLLGTAVVLNKAQFLVSNDSGLMHMATAVRTPVLAIFGSTTKELGFFPYRSKNIVVENDTLWCRPCSHIGRNHCPLFHFKCMKSITPQKVFNALKNWM